MKKLTKKETTNLAKTLKADRDPAHHALFEMEDLIFQVQGFANVFVMLLGSDALDPNDARSFELIGSAIRERMDAIEKLRLQGLQRPVTQ